MSDLGKRGAGSLVGPNPQSMGSDTVSVSVRVELNCRILSWCPVKCLLAWGTHTLELIPGAQKSRTPYFINEEIILSVKFSWL